MSNYHITITQYFFDIATKILNDYKYGGYDKAKKIVDSSDFSIYKDVPRWLEEKQREEKEKEEEKLPSYTKEEVDSWSFEDVKQWLAVQGYYSSNGSLTAPIKGVDPDTDRYAFNAYQRFKRAQSKR